MAVVERMNVEVNQEKSARDASGSEEKNVVVRNIGSNIQYEQDYF